MAFLRLGNELSYIELRKAKGYLLVVHRQETGRPFVFQYQLLGLNCETRCSVKLDSGEREDFIILNGMPYIMLSESDALAAYDFITESIIAEFS